MRPDGGAVSTAVNGLTSGRSPRRSQLRRQRVRLAVPVWTVGARADLGPRLRRCPCGSPLGAVRGGGGGPSVGWPDLTSAPWPAAAGGDVGGELQRVALARALITEPAGAFRRRADRRVDSLAGEHVLASALRWPGREASRSCWSPTTPGSLATPIASFVLRDGVMDVGGRRPRRGGRLRSGRGCSTDGRRLA